MKTVDDRAEFNKSNINCTDGIVHSNFELPVANVAVKLILSENGYSSIGSVNTLSLRLAEHVSIIKTVFYSITI